MYRLQWRGRDGRERFCEFRDLADAVQAGLKVRQLFGNADIVASETGEPVEL